MTDRDKLFEAVKQAWPTELTYTNYRGETAIRRFFPLYLWWGTTEWHSEPGWLLHAWDTDKKAERDFAMAGFVPPTTPTIRAIEASEPPEPRAQCSNCHHFHPDSDDTKYLYGSGLCHLKTEYHKHPKRESSRTWCSAHKPRTPKGE